jgi:hypothetical protein
MQFSMGGLFPSSTLLRMIEEIAAEDDAKLQNGFQAYDSCGKKSMLDSFTFAIFIWKLTQIYYTVVENADECETAAEVYQCGRDNAPAITAAIYTTSSGNSTIVKISYLTRL